jgi:hypothetical protein
MKTNKLIKKSLASFVMQKGAVVILCIVCMLFFMASGCGKQGFATNEESEEDVAALSKDGEMQEEDEDSQELDAEEPKNGDEVLTNDPLSTNEHNEDMSSLFYYYLGEKIFITQVKDKIFIKFAPTPSKEQLLALIGRDVSLRLTDDNSLSFLEKGSSLRVAVLETKDGNSIPKATVEFFKAKEEVVSVEYVFQLNGGKLQGLTDEFVVLLKATTSYAQLQDLAMKNNCIVGDENQFVKNQFKLFVSKTSNFNAIQVSNLFFESGLFEFAEPNSIMLNAFSF